MAAIQTAAGRAAAQVGLVRDDPGGRRALAVRTYGRWAGQQPRLRSYRRAELAFMDWQLGRGVLAPPGADRPGSRWWRACNERLLRDGCEAMARTEGLGGRRSSSTVARWEAFAARPSAAAWYRAHNASIVAAYLEHRDLAEQEGGPERFFCNVVLLRVLYAHALVAAPRLALGGLGRLAPLLGDPRVHMTGLFLSLSRVLPDEYPLGGEVSVYVAAEGSVARLLDFGVIGPRVQAVYEWSADVLDEPEVRSLVREGNPCYAVPVDPGLWQPACPPRDVRAVRRLLGPPAA